jgi:hypothetical protein
VRHPSRSGDSSFRDVITNPENGKWFVIRGQDRLNEVKATHIEGNIYEFVVVEVGQPFVLEDADGRVLVRDRGVVRHIQLFDTLGDGEPGGNILDETSVFQGPHPSEAEDFPYCEIVTELIG